MQRIFTFCLLLILFLQAGCATGPCWKLGHLSPWARNYWAQEEQIAESLMAKRRKLETRVDAAISGGVETQEQMSQELLEIVKNDPIHLMRIEATRQLARLGSSSAATAALGIAARDAAADVRLAAIRGMANRKDPASIPVLVELLGSDSSHDVRMAAVRSLGTYRDAAAIQALNNVLTDSDPALQLAAMDSLEQSTGQIMNRDVRLWRDYIANNYAQFNQTQTADSATSSNSQFR